MKAVWLFSKENHQRSIQLGCISKGHAGAVMGVLKQWKASSAPYLSSVSLRESSAVLFPVSFSSTWINLTFIWYCQKYCINIILTPTVTRWKFWVYLRGQDNKVGGKLLQIAMDKEKLSNCFSSLLKVRLISKAELPLLCFGGVPGTLQGRFMCHLFKRMTSGSSWTGIQFKVRIPPSNTLLLNWQLLPCALVD